MNNPTKLFLTMLFNIVMEYVFTPMLLALPVWYLFFNTLNLPLFLVYAIGGRIWGEIVLRTVADIWFSMKNSR